MNEEFLKMVIDGMTWSFSRINSYAQCPFEWYMKYIECEEGHGSFYADFGTLMHKCLELYSKGETDAKSILKNYENYWNEYIENDLRDKDGRVQIEKEDEYYQEGVKYFENVVHFQKVLDENEILGVEKKINFSLTAEGKEESYPMIGYIDLLLRNKETGAITIMDHKSAKIKFKKDGGIYKSDEYHWRDFKRQLYLYAIPVIEEYGKVDHLAWNLFRLGEIKTIDFNKEEYDEAKIWAVDTIRMIRKDHAFDQNEDYFYCNKLCSMDQECNVHNVHNVHNYNNDSEWRESNPTLEMNPNLDPPPESETRFLDLEKKELAWI